MQNNNGKIQMSSIPMSKRVLAYLTILVGYFFYCYNFSIIDYAKPLLLSSYGVTLEQSALFYTWQSIGAMIGAFGCAWLAENFGRKRVLIGITLVNGLATVANILFTGGIFGFSTFQVWSAMRLIIEYLLEDTTRLQYQQWLDYLNQK